MLVGKKKLSVDFSVSVIITGSFRGDICDEFVYSVSVMLLIKPFLQQN